jgi:hypothetical protein
MANISDIFKVISNVLNLHRTPPPEIPSLLLLSGAKLRPGLSPTAIAAKIISRQHETGAPTGVLPSGNRNISEAMEVIRVEEIINAILTDARVDVAIKPGIPLQATGGNAGGPIAVVGQTIGLGSGNGIIR